MGNLEVPQRTTDGQGTTWPVRGRGCTDVRRVALNDACRLHRRYPRPTSPPRPALVREDRNGFSADPDGVTHAHPAGRSGTAGRVGASPTDLHAAVAAVDTAVDGLAEALDAAVEQGGDTSALLSLLKVIDRAQAGAITLVQRSSGDRSLRANGLPLRDVLAMSSRLTDYERRTIDRVAKALADMPHLTSAYQAGRLGSGEVRAITNEVRGLDAEARAGLDTRFASDDIGDTEADRLVDEVRTACDRLRDSRRIEERELRHIERRFVAIQPQLDGALTLYAELDAEAGATLLEALDIAAGPPVDAGDRDHSRHALDGDRPGAGARRNRGRQRADGLVRLAESYLAGTSDSRRSRPRLQVVTDVATLAGDDDLANASRALWRAFGTAPSLTPDAVRRLASDASLQFILVDGSRVLGVARPTATIPSNVRAAVQVRDQGCRFPGCRTPMAWCDLHHVKAREHGGATTIDNLVAVCRRHHTAVTQGRWHLTMDQDATVTVRRGRRTATSRSRFGKPRQPNAP